MLFSDAPLLSIVLLLDRKGLIVLLAAVPSGSMGLSIVAKQSGVLIIGAVVIECANSNTPLIAVL